MRWLVAVLGALGLLGGLYFGLRTRVHRPVLRVALNLRPGNAEDEARAAGVDLALEERGFRAGRFSVDTAHQHVRPDGSVEIPRPGPHTLLPGLDALPCLQAGENGPFLIPPDPGGEAVAVLDWLEARGLKRIALPFVYSRVRGSKFDLTTGWLREAPDVEVRAFWPRGGNPAGISAQILEDLPEAIFLDPLAWRFPQTLVSVLRADGFQGPIFVAARGADRPGFDGCLVVLAELKPPPPDFLRRFARPPHPFAYAGYLATLDYFYHLDARPEADPFAVAKELRGAAAYEDLRGEARLWLLRNGRGEPPK